MSRIPRHFRSLEDVSREELIALLDLADRLKAERGTPAHPKPLSGKSVALIFEKASTRTRLSFEVGVFELGGHPLVIMAKDTQMGRGEPLADTARILSGYVHGVVIRTFGHDRLEALCDHASIPIVNALTDLFHPCQLLADLQTIRAHFGRLDVKAAWIGDGNNMAHSWILAAARAGLSLRIACPEGYDPDPAVLAKGRELGGDIVVVRDPAEAAEGADVINTDVWASMGQEDEAAARREAFAGYFVDEKLMERVSPEGIFLHCLPAHRGEEVSAEVIDGSRSHVWNQAENRLHAQKALLATLIAN